MRHLGKTPPFRGPDGEILPNSIAEISYLRPGGLDQWVMIRGESLANPLLVLLHGGPGFPEMRLFRTFYVPLEQSFTVVYWMQRGTSKSFDRRMPTSSLTIEQFIVDLDELAGMLRARFGKEKVVLYGHSWGSVLGVLYASRFPEKVAAYVGTGQIGEWATFETASSLRGAWVSAAGGWVAWETRAGTVRRVKVLNSAPCSVLISRRRGRGAPREGQEGYGSFWRWTIRARVSSRTIPPSAERTDADLVLPESRGMTGFKGVFLGSVSRKVAFLTPAQCWS